MIAAQLLAYYFTELKDDQVKKVSAFCSLVLTQAGWTTVKKRRKPGDWRKSAYRGHRVS